MRKNKNHEEHGVSEAWLLPYSDLMTLLLAVFIVLFAVSKIDQTKAEAAANAFAGIFNSGTGFLENTTDEFHIDNRGGSADVIINIDPLPVTQADDPSKADNTEETRQRRMNALSETFKTYFAENELTGVFSVASTPNMITITLDADVVFASGQAELNDDEKIIAKQLAEIIYNAQVMNFTFQVIVSGHTDTVPVNPGRYASNWELSLDRASNFTFAMLADSRLDPRMFYSVGHGELDPVATNDTAEGRAKNRRVEISILSQEMAGQDFPVN